MLIPQNDSMPYARVPNWLMSIPPSILSSGAKLCYARLYYYYNFKGFCCPSATTLAKDLGVSRRQIMKDLNKLQELKLIKVNGRGAKSSIYEFPDNEYRRGYLPVDKYEYFSIFMFLLCTRVHNRCEPEFTMCVNQSSHIITNIYKRINIALKRARVVDNFSFSLESCPAAFKKCMDIYPRTLHRTRTKTTFTLWEKAVAKHGEEKVYEGTAAFARYCAAMKKEPRLVYGRKAFYGKEEHYLTDWADVFEKTKGYNPKSHFTFSSRADDYHKPTKEIPKAQREKNKKSARKLKNKANGGDKSG